MSPVTHLPRLLRLRAALINLFFQHRPLHLPQLPGITSKRDHIPVARRPLPQSQGLSDEGARGAIKGIVRVGGVEDTVEN